MNEWLWAGLFILLLIVGTVIFVWGFVDSNLEAGLLGAVCVVAAFVVFALAEHIEHKGKVPTNCHEESGWIFVGKVMVPTTREECDWLTPTPTVADNHS